MVKTSHLTRQTPAQPKIVFATDSGMFRPTLVAMWSVIRHLSCPAEIHLWGNGLTESHQQAAAHVAAIRPDMRLIHRNIPPEELLGAQAKRHISVTAVAKLFVPRHITGRALYLDGDTQVVGDVAPLFDLDLEGALIAASRDFVVQKHVWPKTYFNSGVILFDCDVIRAKPALMARLEDVACTASSIFVDQDHLNSVFADRVHYLNPAFNSSWGRARRHRRFLRERGVSGPEVAKVKDIVIHYNGAKKPWQRKPRCDLWSLRSRSALGLLVRHATLRQGLPRSQPCTVRAH